jgi:hypothetical protein
MICAPNAYLYGVAIAEQAGGSRASADYALTHLCTGSSLAAQIDQLGLR